MTVDPEIPVPPENYGGIERIVNALINSFVPQGHEVYLVANPDSTNKSIDKLYAWPRLSSRGAGNIWSNTRFLFRTVKEVKPDIIHSFSRLLYLYPVFTFTNIPVIQSYQRTISTKSSAIASMIARRQLSFTSCGRHMLDDHPIANKSVAIHNFTNTEYFRPDDARPKEHLMFLGRIEEIKGAKEAIQVAIETGEKLIIAGNIRRGHERYFETYIRPYLDSPLIQYAGPVNDEQKRFYLQNAKVLLFPIKWEEPFGIVMAEAMACGTPVIGFNKGSVPEVVTQHQTGFIVEDIEEMKVAVSKLVKIDRKLVRQSCEERFSLQKVSNDYLDLYDKRLWG